MLKRGRRRGVGRMARGVNRGESRRTVFSSFAELYPYPECSSAWYAIKVLCKLMQQTFTSPTRDCNCASLLDLLARCFGTSRYPPYQGRKLIDVQSTHVQHGDDAAAPDVAHQAATQIRSELAFRSWRTLRSSSTSTVRFVPRCLLRTAGCSPLAPKVLCSRAELGLAYGHISPFLHTCLSVALSKLRK